MSTESIRRLEEIKLTRVFNFIFGVSQRILANKKNLSREEIKILYPLTATVDKVKRRNYLNLRKFGKI